jgi:hypothetical protein
MKMQNALMITSLLIFSAGSVYATPEFENAQAQENELRANFRASVSFTSAQHDEIERLKAGLILSDRNEVLKRINEMALENLISDMNIIRGLKNELLISGIMRASIKEMVTKKIVQKNEITVEDLVYLKDYLSIIYNTAQGKSNESFIFSNPLLRKEVNLLLNETKSLLQVIQVKNKSADEKKKSKIKFESLTSDLAVAVSKKLVNESLSILGVAVDRNQIVISKVLEIEFQKIFSKEIDGKFYKGELIDNGLLNEMIELNK